MGYKASHYSYFSKWKELNTAADISTAFSDASYDNYCFYIKAGTYNFSNHLVLRGNRDIEFESGVTFIFAPGFVFKSWTNNDVSRYYSTINPTVYWDGSKFVKSAGAGDFPAVDNTWRLYLQNQEYIPSSGTTTTITPTIAPVCYDDFNGAGNAKYCALVIPTENIHMSGSVTISGSIPTGAGVIRLFGLAHCDWSDCEITVINTNASWGYLVEHYYCSDIQVNYVFKDLSVLSNNVFRGNLMSAIFNSEIKINLSNILIQSPVPSASYSAVGNIVNYGGWVTTDTTANTFYDNQVAVSPSLYASYHNTIDFLWIQGKASNLKSTGTAYGSYSTGCTNINKVFWKGDITP